MKSVISSIFWFLFGPYIFFGVVIAIASAFVSYQIGNSVAESEYHAIIKRKDRQLRDADLQKREAQREAAALREIAKKQNAEFQKTKSDLASTRANLETTEYKLFQSEQKVDTLNNLVDLQDEKIIAQEEQKNLLQEALANSEEANRLMTRKYAELEDSYNAILPLTDQVVEAERRSKFYLLFCGLYTVLFFMLVRNRPLLIAALDKAKRKIFTKKETAKSEEVDLTEILLPRASSELASNSVEHHEPERKGQG